jgi:hypothetical protein
LSRRQAQLHLAGGIENGHAGAPIMRSPGLFRSWTYAGAGGRPRPERIAAAWPSGPEKRQGLLDPPRQLARKNAGICEALPIGDRFWIALVLIGQTAVGAILGIAAQALLVVVIIGYVMPFFGLELLDMARDVAAFNLPARMGQLFGVSL